MNKERLVAFTDAVLAIIMTILVLELEKPSQVSLADFWALRMNYFAYIISFFLLGTMWVNLHKTWDSIQKISNKLVWISLLLLFFSSLFPYVTSIVSAHFNNATAQAAYGIVVLLVTFTNTWMYDELAKLPENPDGNELAKEHNRLMIWDIAIKVLGLVLSLTIYPPAMMWAVLIAAVFLIIPRAVKEVE